MNISRIEFRMTPSSDVTLSFTASDKGVVVFPFNRVIERYDPSFTFGDIVSFFIDLYHPPIISVDIDSTTDDSTTSIFKKVYTGYESRQKRGEITVTTFHSAFTHLVYTCALLKKQKVIEGKECPVLLTPLTPSCIILKKCNHYMSREAWNRLEETEEGKKCPLCRALHKDWDITTGLEEE